MEYRFEFTIEGGDPDKVERLFNKIVDYAEENGMTIAGGYHIVEVDPAETEAEDGKEPGTT